MQIIKLFYISNGIDENSYSKKVHERKKKLDQFKLLKEEGCSEEVIFATLEISRAHYYRLQKRYKEEGLAGLEDESRCPRNKRKRKYGEKEEERIIALRKEYPSFGKAKVKIFYEKEYQEIISESTVGRIITKQIKRRKIKRVSDLHETHQTKKRVFKSYAKRWTKEMKTTQPGEMIQIDHMTVTIPNIGTVKQFSAVCPFTRYIVTEVYKKADSKTAANFLKKAISDFPFLVHSVQVDGGSEFMKDFEALCQQLNIPLYVLPPRTPECNGNVERFNRTIRNELYSFYRSPKNNDISDLQAYLSKFAYFYNYKRPHHGINLYTPAQFYEKISKDYNNKLGLQKLPKKSHML